MAALLRHAACSVRPAPRARAFSCHIGLSLAAALAPSSYCTTAASSLPRRSATWPDAWAAALHVRTPSVPRARGSSGERSKQCAVGQDGGQWRDARTDPASLNLRASLSALATGARPRAA